MTLYLYSQNPHSMGGKALADELGIRRIRHGNIPHRTRVTDTIINWGSASSLPDRTQLSNVVNDPRMVSGTVDKLKFFQLMDDKQHNDKRIVPKFWTKKEDAEAILRQRGGSIVCRTVLNGSGGRGIVLADSAEQLVDAPLFVRYIPKQKEFRVHVFDGKVIDMAEKARRLDEPNPDWRIRNMDGGFIFKRNGINVPDCVQAVALECMKHTGLVFGACDVVWKRNENRAYCLEINSAPGIEGQTIKSYADAIREYLNTR